MNSHSEKEKYLCWKVVLEIERFIECYGGEYFSTRKSYYANYYHQLLTLLGHNQIIIERDSHDHIMAVCGWACISKDGEWDVNKIRWTLPEKVCGGNVLYVSFCVSNADHIHHIRQKLIRRYRNEVDEVYWFSTSKHKFIRHKNILKEIALCKTAV